MLVVAKNLQIYFRETLNVAMRESKIELSDTAQAYMIHLLNEFSRSENAFAGAEYGEGPTMVQLMLRAQDAQTDQQALGIYRYMGDISLYLLGFFKESKAVARVSSGYFEKMGAAGYQNAFLISRTYAGPSAEVFLELAERFVEMVILVQNMAVIRKCDWQKN